MWLYAAIQQTYWCKTCKHTWTCKAYKVLPLKAMFPHTSTNNWILSYIIHTCTVHVTTLPPHVHGHVHNTYILVSVHIHVPRKGNTWSQRVGSSPWYIAVHACYIAVHIQCTLYLARWCCEMMSRDCDAAMECTACHMLCRGHDWDDSKSTASLTTSVLGTGSTLWAILMKMNTRSWYP